MLNGAFDAVGAVVVMVSVVCAEPCVSPWLVKVQVEPGGKVPQVKLIPPSSALAEFTVNTNVAVSPGLIVTLPAPVTVSTMLSGGPGTALMVVVSLAVSLAVLISPPPPTVAELVTLPGAFRATDTVSVIGG